MRVVVAGASGYIGRQVVAELNARGHGVIAVVRRQPVENTFLAARLHGADIRVCPVDDPKRLETEIFAPAPVDAVISCLASRSGQPADAWHVEYNANRILLDAARAGGVRHFSLLSALCVQTPVLAFQRAKQAFESILRADPQLRWSIVRPSAFFKSLAGQIERVRSGKPFLLFGPDDGPPCLPISEADTARLIADTLTDTALHGRVLNVGGPGQPITPRQRGDMLFELAGRPPRFRRIPLALLHTAVHGLTAVSGVSGRAANGAEFARIARFYATRPLLALDPASGEPSAAATQRFGHETLSTFYRQAWRHGAIDQALGEQALFDRNRTRR
ncbi:NAD(P)H-binding protein [Salinisphaera sp. Q1T1-3]|uniref:NAD(P)H-binding protein n=1 Tax=Salinisphaera sp. Q1T1-3 TaxID=2321229 RepID=UPI000E70701F|nr:NAD(P)H-binding protein [Salinisphaera sp. Q1T1-3]RJS91342.1 NAD-dependent epimerase/dehydratase family protein [Salinisphaera sp. Q1T1-3]